VLVDVLINFCSAIALIEGYAERSANMLPAMVTIRDLMMERHVQNFEGQGSLLGSWPALKPSTIERKASQGLPPTPMVATGALGRALAGGKGKRTSATRTTARAGVSGGENRGDLFYVRMTQKGTKSGQLARPVIGMTLAAREEYVTIVHTFLERGVAF